MVKDGTNRDPGIPTVMVPNAYGTLLLRAIRDHSHGQGAITANLLLQPRSAHVESAHDAEDQTTARHGGKLSTTPKGADGKESKVLPAATTSGKEKRTEVSEPSMESGSECGAAGDQHGENQRAQVSAKAKGGAVARQSSSDAEQKQQHHGPPSRKEVPQPRLDLLVPTSSNAFVVANILLR